MTFLELRERAGADHISLATGASGAALSIVAFLSAVQRIQPTKIIMPERLFPRLLAASKSKAAALAWAVWAPIEFNGTMTERVEHGVTVAPTGGSCGTIYLLRENGDGDIEEASYIEGILDAAMVL